MKRFLVDVLIIIAFRSVTEGYNLFNGFMDNAIIIAFRSVTEGYN